MKFLLIVFVFISLPYATTKLKKIFEWWRDIEIILRKRLLSFASSRRGFYFFSRLMGRDHKSKQKGQCSVQITS